jgi:hypothetical protein
VYFKYIDTVKHPEQSYFFKYINANICTLYENIIYKELLWFLFKHSRTNDLQDIIVSLAHNIAHFFDNIYGIHIMKTIFEYHNSSPSFKVLYEVIFGQLETILTSR